jgi:hypothetical protein
MQAKKPHALLVVHFSRPHHLLFLPPSLVERSHLAGCLMFCRGMLVKHSSEHPNRIFISAYPATPPKCRFTLLSFPVTHLDDAAINSLKQLSLLSETWATGLVYHYLCGKSVGY